MTRASHAVAATMESLLHTISYLAAMPRPEVASCASPENPSGRPSFLLPLARLCNIFLDPFCQLRNVPVREDGGGFFLPSTCSQALFQ